MKKNGKKLEKIVRIIEEVYRTESAQTEIFSNYKIENEQGNKREIDIFIKSFINDYEINIAIECKEYNKKVECKEVEAFYAKCLRIPKINKKILVSALGFQKDAIDGAKAFGIELYTIKELEENSNKILFPIYQIKPMFEGFEIIDIYYLQNQELALSTINISNETIFKSVNGKDTFSLYQLILECVQPNWITINYGALYDCMKEDKLHSKFRFSVECKGIFIEYKNMEIFIDRIECYAKIRMEVSTPQLEKKVYTKNENGEIKATAINFELDKGIEGSIIVDKNNNMHIFDTSNNEIQKLKKLYRYDRETDNLESFT